MAVGLGLIVKQQFGDTFVAAVGNGAACGYPWELALLDLDALRFGLTAPMRNGQAYGSA